MKYYILGFVFTVLGFLLFSNTTVDKWQSLKPEGSKAENEKDENPLARQKYEFMMLRDPKTNSIPKDIRERELKFAKSLPLAAQVRYSKNKMQKIQALSWSSLGPINRGGRTRAMAIDISNENHLLAGGVSGGMWISTDDGVTWKKTTSAQQLQSVSCIAQDTRAGHTNVFYYGTGEAAGNSASGGSSPYRGNGIYKSTDGGLTWNVLTSTTNTTPQKFSSSFDYVWDIATDPSTNNEDVVYAALFGGIERSSDGGQTWTTVLGNMSSSEFSDVAVTDAGVVYAALSSSSDTAAGLWRSATGLPGSFVKITPSTWPSNYNRIVIGIAPSNNNVVYFLGETPGGGTLGHSLWKYTDGAANPWEDRSDQIPQLGSNGNFDSQGSYDLLIKVKPDNENFVIIGGTNLYRSTDGFATAIDSTGWIGGYSWANDNSSYTNQHPDQHSLVFMPSNPKIMYSGNDGGISKTIDNTATPVVWTKSDNGYITSQFYSASMDMSASNDNQVIGGLQDNGNYLDLVSLTPASWEELPFGGDGGYTAIEDNKTGYIIETQNGYAERLITNSKGQISDYATVRPKGASNFLFIAPFCLDPNNSKVMYMPAGDTLWRNSDITAIPTQSQDPTDVNWSPIINSLSSGDPITAVAASKNPANVVYFGNMNGNVYKVDDASVSSPVVTDISGSDFPQGGYVSSIAVDPTNANDVMVVFSNYSVISLFYSNDGGISWTAVAGNLEQNPDGSGDGPSCRWASILHNNSVTYYFVATSTGLYSTASLNGLNTVWEQEGAGSIGNIVCTMVQARSTDGKVVVATHGNGVYASYMSTVGVNTASNNLPLTYNLYQNYPNPFNPSTDIRYSLPSSSNVVLKIYDVSGREVKTLISAEQPAGVHDYNFDASSLASGVYFYSLRAGNYTQTKKMILMK